MCYLLNLFFNTLTLDNNNYVTLTLSMKLKQNGGRGESVMWVCWFLFVDFNRPRAHSDFIAFIFKYTYTATRIIINQLLIKCTITRTITFPQLYSVRSNQRKVMSFVTAEKNLSDCFQHKHTWRVATKSTQTLPHTHHLLLLRRGERLPSLSIASVLHTETNVVYLQ